MRAPQERLGKRERLIDAASRLFHEQGVERTTIADIAAAADVPLGNVYYYFKTRDDIINAVVFERVANFRTTVEELEKRHRSPAARLKALFKELSRQSEMIAQYGCPYGTLCSELAKRSQASDPCAVQLLQAPIDWAEMQFRAMGRRDAHELAIELIAAYQGAAVLTNTLGTPELMRREARRVDHWVDSL